VSACLDITSMILFNVIFKKPTMNISLGTNSKPYIRKICEYLKNISSGYSIYLVYLACISVPGVERSCIAIFSVSIAMSYASPGKGEPMTFNIRKESIASFPCERGGVMTYARDVTTWSSSSFSLLTKDRRI